MASNTNKRASLLLSNLSAIDTSLGFNGLGLPASAVPSPLFSSATIASTASSGSPVQPLTPLCHPTPRRCSAANSAFMASDAEVRAPTPPKRPITPLSPAVTRNIRPMSFFSDDSSEAESPLSPYILSPTFQDMVIPSAGLRSRWADLNKPPTPAPLTGVPVLPPTANQRAAIKQWESKVPRYLPVSPVEEEIGALSQQITELHAHIAASEQMFKNGMMYVYIHQNAQAAALVHSPNLLQAPWHNEEREEPLSPEEMECMEGVKQSLRDRLEKEVNEVERRALRDLEMVRGVRHGLILEAERESARERRRNLQAELQLEMEREKERQQQQRQQDKMDIDNDNDSGFAESETLDAPIMLDVKSLQNSPIVRPQPDEIVFSFSTEEIDNAVAESLDDTPSPDTTATTTTTTTATTPSSSDNDSDSSSASSSESSSRTTSPATSLPPVKSISPKRSPPAPLNLSSGPKFGDITSPMLSLFRSPLSPCFSPMGNQCSPMLSPPMLSPPLLSAASFAPLGSARMSVDFAAGLGFDLSGVNIGPGATVTLESGKVALCA